MNHNNKAGWKRTYFLIWIGQVFSLFGSELVQFSLVWFLTKETGSTYVLAMASFVALLPKVFLSPFIGVFIDRWNRQKIMIFADAFVAIFTMLLAAIFWLDAIEVWHIYVIMFVRAIGSNLQWTSMQASTSLLVPREQLSRVSGLNQTLDGALGILAPMAAALLLDTIPMYGLLAIDVITAIIAISTLMMVVIPQPVEKKQRTFSSAPRELWQDVREGFKYLVNWRGMFILALLATIINFLLNPGFTFTPLLVTDHFNMGVIELSLIEVVFSIGMIAGGLVLSVWGGFHKRIVTILVGVLGVSVSTALIAAANADQFSLAVAGMALTGMMMPITNGPIYAIMQAHVEPEIQGRVLTLMNSMAAAMMPISMLIAAPVAEWIGIRGWMAVASVGCLLIVVIGFSSPALMKIETSSGKYISSSFRQETEQDQGSSK